MGVHLVYWLRHGITPLWITFRNNVWGRAPLVLEALKAWPHAFDADGNAIVALTVLPNVARERVLDDLHEQLEKLSDALQSIPPSRSTARDTAESDPPASGADDE